MLRLYPKEEEIARPSKVFRFSNPTSFPRKRESRNPEPNELLDSGFRRNDGDSATALHRRYAVFRLSMYSGALKKARPPMNGSNLCPSRGDTRTRVPVSMCAMCDIITRTLLPEANSTE